MLEIDLEGWRQQNAGRDLWQLIREGVQNALDTGADVEILLNTRSRKIVIQDEGSGFDDLSEAWTVFKGSKGDYVTKRGRFGRGLKELLTGCERLKVETTSGMVTFDMTRENKFVDEDYSTNGGTRITAENSEWSAEEMREVQEWAKKLWVPEEQNVSISVKGGKDIQKRRSDWEPDFTFSSRLETVRVENGVQTEGQRRCEVEVKKAKSGEGRIYEMEIPVNLEEDFPYWVNIPQKIPMAEQRNSAERDFIEGIIGSLIDERIDHIPRDNLRDEWLTKRLNSYNTRSTTQRKWAKRVFGEDTVLKSVPAADDRAEQKGMNVIDASQKSKAVAKTVRKTFEKSSEWVEEYNERNSGKEVDPSDAQQEFMDKVREEVLQPLDMRYVDLKMWEFPADENGNVTVAQNGEGVVKLNVMVKEWTEFNEDTVSVILHELAHEGTEGHGDGFIKHLERLGAQLAMEKME